MMSDPARSPRGRVHGAVEAGQPTWTAVGPQGPHTGRGLASRHEGDLPSVRRPRWGEVVGWVVSQLPGVTGAEIQGPDVVVAAAVGRERDVIAVRRPVRLAVVEWAAGQWAGVTAVMSHRPDVPGATAVGLEDDGRAVWRPGRLSRVVELVQNACRLAAGDREGPQSACKSMTSVRPSGETATAIEVPSVTVSSTTPVPDCTGRAIEADDDADPDVVRVAASKVRRPKPVRCCRVIVTGSDQEWSRQTHEPNRS